ncbi:MAG TPA: hypothetical protein V6D11_23495 [Waterburya sp.]|jgi:predicted protein tyrosine phosphatase
MVSVIALPKPNRNLSNLCLIGCARKLTKKFQPWLKDKQAICPGIPDEYEYMEPALVELLKKKVLPLLGTF